jgi:hypothetical protein
LSPLVCCRTVIFQKPTAERAGGGGAGTLAPPDPEQPASDDFGFETNPEGEPSTSGVTLATLVIEATEALKFLGGYLDSLSSAGSLEADTEICLTLIDQCHHTVETFLHIPTIREQWRRQSDEIDAAPAPLPEASPPVSKRAAPGTVPLRVLAELTARGKKGAASRALAETLEISPGQLGKILPQLMKQGKVTKRGNTYFVTSKGANA